MRQFLFNVHIYLALAAGVFVLIPGLTGCFMAFEPGLDHLLLDRSVPRLVRVRRSILSGPFGVLDYQELHRAFCRFQAQAKLFG